MHRIIAIDPGVTTGICTARLKADYLFVTPNQVKATLAQMYTILNDFIGVGSTQTHVIYEDFEYRNQARAGLDLTPVKIIGVIQLIQECNRTGSTIFYRQTAAMGKAYYSDDKLKELGIYKKGVPHGMDATRHLMHWLEFRAGAQYTPEGLIENLHISLTN